MSEREKMGSHKTRHDRFCKIIIKMVSAGKYFTISFSFSVTDKEYKSKWMFPFFDGLLPEGWLLDIAVEQWKVRSGDKMGLLLVCCKDCVGAVSIYPMSEEMS